VTDLLLDNDEQIDHKVRRLEEQFERLTLIGAGGVTTEGDIWRGFAVAIPSVGDEIGACCHWYGCADETQAVCLSDGNFPIWFGPGTRCAGTTCPSYVCCYCNPDTDCFTAASPSMCTYYGFTSAGLGTSCDDCTTSEIVPPCGCCCFDGDCSYAWTQSDCEGSGGTFTEGLCCQSIVHCDSISASKTKCGFDEFTPSDPVIRPKYRTNTCDYSVDSQSAFYQFSPHICECPEIQNVGSISFVSTYDDDCNLVIGDCEGGVTKTIQNAHVVGGVFHCDFVSEEVLCFTDCNISCAGSSSVTPTSRTDTCTFPGCNPANGLGSVGGDTATQTLTDEYTTEELIANAIAALPDYRGCFDCLSPCDEVEEGDPCCDPAPITGQDCNCTADFHLSDDETVCDVGAFKYYIEVVVAASDQLVTWVERFTPDDGGDPIDTERSETVLAGDIYTSTYTIDVPTDYGTTAVEDIICKAT